jgi:pyruvate formate lyase activating enzyme
MRAMAGGVSVKGLIESSFLDWPGRVAAVLFTPGCNFRCPFCHNAPLVLTPHEFEDIPLDCVLESLDGHAGWVDGVVVTGGEPTVWPGLTALLGALAGTGLPVKLDTNGSNPVTLKSLIDAGLVQAVALDVKAPLEPKSYRAAAGAGADVTKVAESVRVLLESGIETTFRATVVPGLHEEAGIRAMAGALSGRPLILQNFRPAGALDPEFRKIKPFSPEELRQLQAVADGI